MKRIGIVILATNAYFVLGIRFIKKFMHYYKGDCKVTFYLFTDTSPFPYLPANSPVKFYTASHKNWEEGTNSKFLNFIRIENDLRQNQDYVYYFDADTNIDKEFTEEWMLGDMVGGEHSGNLHYTSQTIPFDRVPRSRAYIPKDTPLKQIYYYGAFFGGKVENVLYFCKKLIENQIADREWGYEPGVNDESYINQWFHFNVPTKSIPCHEFKFLISDKGGLGETRDMKLDVNVIKEKMLELKDDIFDIQNGKITQ